MDTQVKLRSEAQLNFDENKHIPLGHYEPTVRAFNSAPDTVTVGVYAFRPFGRGKVDRNLYCTASLSLDEARQLRDALSASIKDAR